MNQLSKRLWAPILAAALCLPIACAQQQPPPPTNPIPPAAPVPAAGQQTTQSKKDQEPASPVLSGSPTVTGSLAPSVGDSGDTHSQLTGSVLFSELFDSNFQSVAGSPGWDELTTIGGHVELHRMGAGSDLMLRYVGGGYVDPRNSTANSSYHQFEASETLQFRRWSLTLNDVFSYLPEAAFGFGGNGLAGGPAIGIMLVNPFAVPSQSILTNIGKRISNSFLAQAQVDATPRSSWTFSGSYGLLHFTDSSNLDSTDASFSVGYNYQLSPRNLIGVSDSFSALRFSPAIESINDNSVLVIFGHHVSDRLMFTAGVGPDVYSVSSLFGPSTGAHASWAANAGLAYHLARTSLNASFSHGVSGGAGVLAGASSNTVQFSASRQLGQSTTFSGSIGFATNGSLPGISVASTHYDTVIGSLGFSRKLSRSLSVNVSYNFSHQTTNAAPCTGPGCAGPFLRHEIWVGFSWDMHPVPIN